MFSLEQLYNDLNKGLPIFSTLNSENFFEPYESINNSVKLLNELLDKQFEHTNITKFDFLNYNNIYYHWWIIDMIGILYRKQTRKLFVNVIKIKN